MWADRSGATHSECAEGRVRNYMLQSLADRHQARVLVEEGQAAAAAADNHMEAEAGAGAEGNPDMGS